MKLIAQLLMLYGDEKKSTFLKLVTGKSAAQWSAQFDAVKAECGVII